MPKWYKQKMHSVVIEPKDLAHTNETDWDKVDMNEVHRMWHVFQAIQLQPPNLAYSYEVFGVSAATLEIVLGFGVVTKIFGEGATVAPQDAAPDQVINLLKVQMQKLSDRLKAEQDQGQYKAAQTDADAAISKYLPILHSEKQKRKGNPY